MRHAMQLAHDNGIRIVNRILVGCSMCLSGYFGWVLGEGVFPLNIVLALMCASVAYGVSLMFERAAGYNVLGLRANAVLCWIIGALFLAANTLFDYSSAAAVREAVATAATNANNKASDVRGNMDLLRKNIADAKGSTAWQAHLLPSSAYEAEIRNLEGFATVMKRSNQCADQTREDTKAHCEKLAAAKANLAMALQRKSYEGQIEKWESELGRLTAKAETTEFAANPAIAQVRAVTSWFKLDRNLTDTNLFWGQNAIMLLMTVLVNAGLAFLGNEIGTGRAMALQASQGGDFPHPAQLYLPRSPQPQGPQPLKVEPTQDHHQQRWNHSETIIVAGGQGGGPDVPDIDPAAADLLAKSEAANEKVRRMLAEMKAVGTA